MNHRLTIYGTPRYWRWTLQAAGNWRTIGASTEAYRNRGDCLANALRVVGDLTLVRTDSFGQDIYEVTR